VKLDLRGDVMSNLGLVMVTGKQVSDAPSERGTDGGDNGLPMRTVRLNSRVGGCYRGERHLSRWLFRGESLCA
jgi:hypothetical protein